jgi:dipeptidase
VPKTLNQRMHINYQREKNDKQKNHPSIWLLVKKLNPNKNKQTKIKRGKKMTNKKIIRVFGCW